MIVMVVHLLVTKQVVFVMNTLFFPLFVVLLKKKCLRFRAQVFFLASGKFDKVGGFFFVLQDVEAFGNEHF